jgi:hypothetical protein
MDEKEVGNTGDFCLQTHPPFDDTNNYDISFSGKSNKKQQSGRKVSGTIVENKGYQNMEELYGSFR